MKDSDNRLDELTTLIAQSGGIGDDEVERFVSNQFFNARVRARIDAERRRGEEQGSGWLVTLLVGARAIAVLLLVTVGAAAAFWITRPGGPPATPPDNADGLGRVITGGTCALSTTEECAISNDEVLATLFREEGGYTTK